MAWLVKNVKTYIVVFFTAAIAPAPSLLLESILKVVTAPVPAVARFSSVFGWYGYTYSFMNIPMCWLEGTRIVRYISWYPHFLVDYLAVLRLSETFLSWLDPKFLKIPSQPPSPQAATVPPSQVSSAGSLDVPGSARRFLPKSLRTRSPSGSELVAHGGFSEHVEIPTTLGNIAMEHRHFEYLNQLQMLVGGWNFFIFHNIWDNPSHWLIFFRGVETTNQNGWFQ